MQTIHFRDMGRVGYEAAWSFQETLMQANLSIKAQRYNAASPNAFGAIGAAIQSERDTTNHLLFCEHPHVYTLGKSGHIENLLVNDSRLKELDVSFFKTNRGGDITYHGPGQIVGYPILDLEHFVTDLGKYMRNLEEVIIRTLSYFGIEGGRLQGATGVWLDAGIKGKTRKICAMGVRCSRWVTMHGFALNVNTDLRYFDYIVPCGIADKSVTSMQKELGEHIDESEVKERLRHEFGTVFDADIVVAEEALVMVNN